MSPVGPQKNGHLREGYFFKQRLGWGPHYARFSCVHFKGRSERRLRNRIEGARPSEQEIPLAPQHTIIITRCVEHMRIQLAALAICIELPLMLNWLNNRHFSDV